MSVFLDYASTNPNPIYRCCDYGPFMNVNANYAYKEKRLIRECEERVKVAIEAKSGKVVFGGTSSQLIENLMMGINSRVEDYRIITSTFEHDAIHRFSHGQLFDLSELELALRDASNNEFITPFICWQAVQNVTGEIFPGKQIGELVHKYHGFYICDGTAQIGHTPIECNIDDWCDFYVMSGHKLSTELGIGAMWISDRLNDWLGDFTLHGTPNLAGACAIADAVEHVTNKKWIMSVNKQWYTLLLVMLDLLKENNIDYNVIRRSYQTEGINAIRLPGINADSLQQFLAAKHIYIGVGHSSCSDNSDFRILEQGYGLSNQEASEVIRISFGEDSTVKDVETLVDNIVSFKKEYVND